MSEIRVKPGDLVPFPQEWDARHYELIDVPCNMLIGPCCCGATHNVMEWWVQELLQAFKTTIVYEQQAITGDIKAGDVVTFKAYEGQSNHWLTVGQVKDDDARVYWFTRDNELKVAQVPVVALAKIETRGGA